MGTEEYAKASAPCVSFRRVPLSGFLAAPVPTEQKAPSLHASGTMTGLKKHRSAGSRKWWRISFASPLILLAFLASIIEAAVQIDANDYLLHGLLRLSLFSLRDALKANALILLLSCSAAFLLLSISTVTKVGSASRLRGSAQAIVFVTGAAIFSLDWLLRSLTDYAALDIPIRGFFRVEGLVSGRYSLGDFLAISGAAVKALLVLSGAVFGLAFILFLLKPLVSRTLDFVQRGLSSPTVTRSANRLAVVVLGLCSIAFLVGERTAPRFPNVVWIVIDALRADHVGAYGYHADTTPFIDGLAEQGKLFRSAYSQESYTLASAASYLTSTYPSRHKVLYVSPRVDKLPKRALTLAEVLRDEGFSTAAFVFNPSLKATFAFDQGFEVYDDNREGFDYSLPQFEAFETAKKIESKVNRYLARHTRRPVFLYLHYRDVHSPYVPPPPYHEMFAPEGIEVEPDAIPKFGLPFEGNRELYVSQYDAEIRYVDDALRQLFRSLESHQIHQGNTIFVISSDHGEEFGEERGDLGGIVGHGRTLYDEQIHVPLIFLGPGVPPGRIAERPVELVDIVPTILEAAGIDSSRWQCFQGANLLEGEPDEEWPIISGGSQGRAAVRLGDWKYYRYRPGAHASAGENFRAFSGAQEDRFIEELYRLSTDSLESDNLIASEIEKANELKQIVVEHRRKRATGRRRVTSSLDAETEEQLRALGYIE